MPSIPQVSPGPVDLPEAGDGRLPAPHVGVVFAELPAAPRPERQLGRFAPAGKVDAGGQYLPLAARRHRFGSREQPGYRERQVQRAAGPGQPAARQRRPNPDECFQQHLLRAVLRFERRAGRRRRLRHRRGRRQRLGHAIRRAQRTERAVGGVGDSRPRSRVLRVGRRLPLNPTAYQHLRHGDQLPGDHREDLDLWGSRVLPDRHHGLAGEKRHPRLLAELSQQQHEPVHQFHAAACSYPKPVAGIPAIHQQSRNSRRQEPGAHFRSHIRAAGHRNRRQCGESLLGLGERYRRFEGQAAYLGTGYHTVRGQQAAGGVGRHRADRHHPGGGRDEGRAAGCPHRGIHPASAGDHPEEAC